MKRLLYVATPGVRNDVAYGGLGMLVYDIDGGHKLARRFSTFQVEPEVPPENVKGIVAHAGTARVYVSTIKRIGAFDLGNDVPVWIRTYEGGCDRLALSPDGKVLYVPSLEGPHWLVVAAASGDVITRLEPKSGAHNTIFGPSGKAVYMAGLKSPLLSIADTSTHKLARTCGPFAASIRPFTVNGAETLVYVNVNELLGFEVGDLRSGKKLHRVEVPGFKRGPVKRHGCPSHGIGLTPDETELWVCDAFNKRMHLFDATMMPPRYKQSLALRDEPGWVTFSLDGKYGYPSTGEVFESKSKKLVATLSDETGRPVMSEKMLEIDFEGESPVRAGNQFGIGRKLG